MTHKQIEAKARRIARDESWNPKTRTTSICPVTGLTVTTIPQAEIIRCES